MSLYTSIEIIIHTKSSLAISESLIWNIRKCIYDQFWLYIPLADEFHFLILLRFLSNFRYRLNNSSYLLLIIYEVYSMLFINIVYLNNVYYETNMCRNHPKINEHTLIISLIFIHDSINSFHQSDNPSYIFIVDCFNIKKK